MDGAPGLAVAGCLSAMVADHSGASSIACAIDLRNGLPTLIDPYAATAPAEFFAVVTEVFFEKPRELAAMHAPLYEQLRRYYRLDPARWTEIE